MASARFVEVISHCPGYIQIFQDIARDPIDETALSRPMVTPHYDHPVTAAELQSYFGACYEA
jgi:hypothetical protein